MTTRPFKSISPQELEAAIASAISALTNTETKVSIAGWKEVETDRRLTSNEKYDFQLSITAGKSYNSSSFVPPGMKTELHAGDDEEIKF